MAGPTLIQPPRLDASKSPMENVLELTALSQVQPDLYTNTRQLWRPPGSRGVYGGAVIAQCLSSAFKTVPLPSSADNYAVFYPHSMHCYFVLAGDADIPIIYHVERVREGKSFLTRTVQARQKGKCIFTTTISFVREGSEGRHTIQHGWDMPPGVLEGLDRIVKQEEEAKRRNEPMSDEEKAEAASNGVEAQGPFISKRLGIYNNVSPLPHARRPQSWLRCRGSLKGDYQEHLSALAYMSDSWFIGTIARVHHFERFGRHSESEISFLRQVAEMERLDQASNLGAGHTEDVLRTDSPNTPTVQPRKGIGMMVSLDHTIYFHRPGEVKADEWMLSEMESPWTGEGRGLVTQRIWNRDGRLLATCIQEGLTRLQQDDEALGKSKL